MNEEGLKSRRRKKIIGIAAAVCLLLAASYFVARSRPVQVEIAAVKRGVFEETFKSDGRLRSKDKYTVPAFANGDLMSRVTLKAGDEIKKGDPIVELFWDKHLTIRAPISGVVSQVFRDSMGPIVRGAPIIEIIDPTQIEVITELLTPDATRIRVGASILVEGWGGPAFRGKVHRISKAGFVKPSALGVEEERTEIQSELDHGDPALITKMGNNFHVDVIFYLSRQENVLQIPIGSLFRDGNQWAVFVVQKGRAQKRMVTLGARNDRDTVLLTGLSEGETVILYPGDLIRENIRVKARTPAR